MRVVELTTVQVGEFPNLCFVLVRTEDGVVGLGETFFGAPAVAAWIHDSAAPYLLGQDPRDITRHSVALRPFVGFSGTGVENRARSAVDVALWDVLGQITGMPLYRLLGGRCRDSVRIYNTCAGATYTRARPRSPDLPVTNWSTGHVDGEPYDDLNGFLTDAGALAKELLAEGITAMKIWPFDECAEQSGGHYLSASELRRGVEPFEKIREAVGDAMDVVVELHAKWDLPNAVRIARAVEQFQPLWIEDPLRMDDMAALRRFTSATAVPTGASETVGNSSGIREVVDRGGASVVLFDPAWAGGITEARKISTVAEDRQLPAVCHDCTGPVNFAVNAHLSASMPSAFIQEGVRAFYRGWYRQLVTHLPVVDAGHVTPLEGPGIGTALHPQVWERPDLEVRSSRLGD